MSLEVIVIFSFMYRKMLCRMACIRVEYSFAVSGRTRRCSMPPASGMRRNGNKNAARYVMGKKWENYKKNSLSSHLCFLCFHLRKFNVGSRMSKVFKWCFTFMCKLHVCTLIGYGRGILHVIRTFPPENWSQFNRYWIAIVSASV